jgi:transposase
MRDRSCSLKPAVREKIVEALERGMGKSQAARTFSVSLSSVKRYAKLAQEGRSLAPKKRPGSKPKLDERSSKLLQADLEEHPFLTLQERCEYLRAVASVEVSRSTVCRAIKRMDSTRKKGVDRLQNATSS